MAENNTRQKQANKKSEAFFHRILFDVFDVFVFLREDPSEIREWRHTNKKITKILPVVQPVVV